MYDKVDPPPAGQVRKTAAMPSCPPLHAEVLDWFAAHRRDLPWRRTYEPYQVWISEIMLQQTQMERVVFYFSRWLERFPDIATLAAAAEDEVLSLWEGLGYYSRARNLHRAARLLAANGAGVPDNYDLLRKLPGVGPYTAAAVMSIAFNRDYPVVDANVERLFARLFDLAVPVKSREGRDFIGRQAAALLPPGRSRDFNQALMELGALVCLPKNPRCADCPLVSRCAAHQQRTVAERPLPVAGRKTVRIEMACGVLVRNNRILIQKRQADDVWGNLWEFPGGRLKEGESPEEAVVREFREETGLHIGGLQKITAVRHSYMHYRVILHGFICAGAGEPELHAAQENRWVRFADLDGFAFPAGHRKLIKFLQESGYPLSPLPP
jgi:A/G-specific adenine glycosylase